MSKGNLLTPEERRRFEEQGNKGLSPRLVIFNDQIKEYILLRPKTKLPNSLSPSEWNEDGRKYKEREMKSLYHQQEQIGVKLYFYPPTLELEIRNQPLSQLEQTSSAQPL